MQQHQDIADVLLASGEMPIVEVGRIDDEAGRRWGEVNGRGWNYLGRMMERARGLIGGYMRDDKDLDERLENGRAALDAAWTDLNAQNAAEH